MSRQGRISLDTIGKLHACHRGLFGWCRRCASLYRMSDPPERQPPSAFDIDMAALIAERGADCQVVGMTPVPSPLLRLAADGGSDSRAVEAAEGAAGGLILP